MVGSLTVAERGMVTMAGHCNRRLQALARHTQLRSGACSPAANEATAGDEEHPLPPPSLSPRILDAREEAVSGVAALTEAERQH